MQTNSKLYQTDQIRCFDYRGQEINCPGTGQDGDIRAGNTRPIPRFDAGKAVVKDFLSGLMWTKDATPARFPRTWKEAFEYVDQMNTTYSYGYDDWRLPDRYELFSLISHSQVNPSLPANHPFTNVFAGYYWTYSPCCQWPKQAWYIHLGGGRVFKGMKQGSYLVWPVRNIKLYKPLVSIRFIEGHRFDKRKDIAIDRSTGLMWPRLSAGSSGTVDWTTSLSFIKEMNVNKACGFDD